MVGDEEPARNAAFAEVPPERSKTAALQPGNQPQVKVAVSQ